VGVSGMRVRLRLTLLYGGLFLLSGVVLLTIIYLLVRHSGSTAVLSTHTTAPSGDESVSVILGGRLPADAQLTETERRIAGAFQRQALQQQDETMRQLLVQSGVALAVMSVVAVVLGWLMAGRVLRPLRTMTATIQRISAHTVHERLAVAGPADELKSLADTVDGLLGRLETALESHKRFVANAAHELRTPLTLEHALLEETLLDPDTTTAEFRARVEEVLGISEQQARLLESLLVLATSQRGLDRWQSVDLSVLTGDVLRAAESSAGQRDLTVTTELRPAAVIGDPGLVERMVANLVDNAISHNIPHGRVEVATGNDDDRCFVSVANTGPLVPPEAVELLRNPFERLDRTAGDDGHHGLGLSIVESIATAHSARLTLRAQPAGGLVATIVFPGKEIE
jgi:signal transduction histidine kinase